jgi:hypothetical protein
LLHKSLNSLSRTTLRRAPMVKRLDTNLDQDIDNYTMLKEIALFTEKNSTAIAEKLDGKQFYYVNKCFRVGLNDEERKELAALKRSIDEVKTKKRNNVIDSKTTKVIF